LKFFKYVTAETAKIILESGNLRWSSPALFNDPFDVQFDLHLEYEEQTIVDHIADELWEIYSGRKELMPANELGRMFQFFLRRVPGLSREQLFGKQQLRSAISGSVNKTKELIPGLHAHQRKLLQASKLFCVSEVHDNILMWSHYARDHTGVVLEFDTDKNTDSPLMRAERVVYSKRMPRLMTQADMVRFFSGQARMDESVIMHDSIFTKAEDWSYEREWRVWLPGTDAAKPFLDLGYEIAELVGIYFGCRISDENQQTLVNLTARSAPHLAKYRAKKSAREFLLEFERLS
jgi:hypothetical protein